MITNWSTAYDQIQKFQVRLLTRHKILKTSLPHSHKIFQSISFRVNPIFVVLIICLTSIDVNIGYPITSHIYTRIIVMLLRWQAKILNLIYQTTLYDAIVLPSSDPSEINYAHLLHAHHQHSALSPQEQLLQGMTIDGLLHTAHTLCHQANSPTLKKEAVMRLNSSIVQMHRWEETKPYNLLHVITFSCLSKCTIWPAMFKTSHKLVPALIDFYNGFFKQYTRLLDYKFDPVILSDKYNRLVKHLKDKKKAHPQLFQAVRKQDHPQIHRIVKESEEGVLNQCVLNGQHITHHATSHCSMPTLRLLLQMGADFELLDEEEQTPLFYAVKREDLEVVRFLVEEVKVNINHTEYQKRTPIYLAAFEGSIEIVRYLHAQGADPTIESKLARTPLSKACYLGNIEVVKFLIELGVELEGTDSRGRTALHNAAWGRRGGREGKRRGHIFLFDSPQSVELLIKAGHKVDFEDKDKFTPLFSAISSHADESLRLLVKYGANLGHLTIKLESAVFIACKYGHLPIITMLIEEYGCEFQKQNNQGYSPLMATLTLDNPDCFYYMADVHYHSQVSLDLNPRALACLTEFKKQHNLQYIFKWATKDQQEETNKLLYVAKCLKEHYYPILESMGEKDQAIFGHWLALCHQFQDHLDEQAVSKLFEVIGKYRWMKSSSVPLIVSLHRTSKVQMPEIHLSEELSEEAVMIIMEVDSSLTSSKESLYQTMLRLIGFRYTKVILDTLDKCQREDLAQEGVGKFSKYDLIEVLNSPLGKKMSLVDYCLVNGYYDIHKIFTAFYNQNYEMGEINLPPLQSVIPNYQYVRQATPQFQSVLHPMPEIRLRLQPSYVHENWLSEEDHSICSQVFKQAGALKVDPLLVRSGLELDQMKSYLSGKRLLGIDVENYSSKDQSFICLIQISTFDRVYVIDKFTHIHKELQLFLAQLFGDESIVKVFHSYDNDLKWLAYDYHVPEFRSVVDTSRLYHIIKQSKSVTPSLKKLAADYLGVEVGKEYQKSDWRIRPLFKQMLDYAAMDAKILPFLLVKMVHGMNALHCENSQHSKMLKSLEVKKIVKTGSHINRVLPK